MEKENEKKTKKIKSIVILIILLLLILTMIMLIFNQYNSGDLLLSYSYGGGYGTYGQTMSVNIDVYTNGKIKLTDGEKNIKKQIIVDINDINELKDLVNNSVFLNLDSDISNYDCLDSGFSKITVYLEKNEFKTGGYCISNNIYIEVASKIKNTVGYDLLSDFREKIIKYYDE